MTASSTVQRHIRLCVCAGDGDGDGDGERDATHPHSLRPARDLHIRIGNASTTQCDALMPLSDLSDDAVLLAGRNRVSAGANQ